MIRILDTVSAILYGLWELALFLAAPRLDPGVGEKLYIVFILFIALWVYALAYG